MMELAWPMVATLAILCATVLVQMYVPARREMDGLRLLNSTDHERLVKLDGEFKALRGETLGRLETIDAAMLRMREDPAKEIAELKSRLAKLELSGLGRRTG